MFFIWGSNIIGIYTNIYVCSNCVIGWTYTYVHPITPLMQTYGIAPVFCKHLLLCLPNQPLKNTSSNVYWGRKWAGSVQPHELHLVNCYSTHICLLHVLYLRIPLKAEIFGNLKKVISDFWAANSVAYCIFLYCYT